MLVKDFKKILKKSDDNKELCIYLEGNVLVVQDTDTTVEDRVDLIIDDEPIYSRDVRIEELEQQNAFECEAVSERDAKLKELRKRIMSIHKKVSPEVALVLLEMLGIIDQ